MTVLEILGLVIVILVVVGIVKSYRNASKVSSCVPCPTVARKQMVVPAAPIVVAKPLEKVLPLAKKVVATKKVVKTVKKTK